MTLIEIENMKSGAIKAAWDEAVRTVQAAPLAELAERYVQARFDASARDEKLGEQGRTILALQEALESAKEAVGSLRKDLAAAESAGKKAAEIAAAGAKALATAQADAGRWETLARARRGALAVIQSKCGELLAQE